MAKIIKLGDLKRLDPRHVWAHEALDFTPWVSENLERIGELLGLDLELVTRESGVGDFSIDVLAKDLGRDRLVVIENQLEPTDHTHLGQVITYAAGVDAGVVVWICREFREEHRQALDWLNQRLGAATQFFGVVIELLQIDDSQPAPNFRLVASPHEWSKTAARAAAASELSGKMAAYQQFFQHLIDELREKHHFTNARAGQPQNWYSFSSGVKGFSYGVSFGLGGRLRVELYIDVGETAQNEKALDALKEESTPIESQFGGALEWENLDGKRACRIACYRQGSIDDPADRFDEYQSWAVDRLLKLKRVFGPKLQPIADSLRRPDQAISTVP